jgi:hypothetical protein
MKNQIFVSLAALAVLAGVPGIAADKKEGWASIDAGFTNPPAEFRIVQFSAHDGSLVPFEKMAAAGIGGIELFMQSDGYLKKEAAWENVRKNLEAAQKAGFQVWMADDNGYPTGMAGGQIVEADAALENRCLRQVIQEGNGSGPVRLDLPKEAEKFIHAFLCPVVDGNAVLEKGASIPVQADRIETQGLPGPWKLYAFAVQVNREGTQAASTKEQFLTNGRYGNLLNPAAMEKFVSLTHEEYARRFGPLKGKIRLFYANEPNLMALWYRWEKGVLERPGGVVLIPWDAGLPRRFQEKHGYDLLSRLPALYGGDDTSSKLVRRHFYETVGRVLAENFSARIGSWAEKNGIEAASHPLLEESMLQHVACYGDFVRFLEPLQVPACDLPMPNREAYNLENLHFGAPHNYWMPKLLSSVAQAGNHDTVGGLMDLIIARPFFDYTPLPGNIRRIGNLGALGGVNPFTCYFVWGKYDPAVYRAINEYIGRVCLVLRGARSAATVGVYYPIETFQAEFLPSPSTWSREFWPKAWHRMEQRIREQDEVVRSLFLQGIDFTWLHGDWIEKARVEKGWLVAANGRYRTIVMPELELLPLAVARKLEEFEKAGGKVLWVKSLPQMGDSSEEHEKVRAMFAKKKILSPGRVAEAIGQGLPPGFTLETGPEVLTARFIRDGRRITYLVNYQADKVTVPVTLAPGSGRKFDVYHPMDGTIQPQELPGTLTIPGDASLMVVEPSRSTDSNR